MKIVSPDYRKSIFVSTACLSQVQTLSSRLDLYSGYGLDRIELGAGVLVHKECLIRLNKQKGSWLVHNYFPPPADSFVLNLASNNKDTQQQSLGLISTALKLTASLGAPFYSFHGGFITDPSSFGTTSFTFPMPSSPKEGVFAFERFIQMLKTVLGWAQKNEIRVLIENNVCSSELRGKLLLQTTDEFLNLFDALASPSLGILVDTGHLNVTARTFGFDPLTFIDRLKSYIHAFHIHDNNGIEDTHSPVEAGRWSFDILNSPEFRDLPIVVEAKFDSVSELRDHVDWLKTELGRN